MALGSHLAIRWWMRLSTLFPCFRILVGQDFCNTYVGGVAPGVGVFI